ncbi:MAG: DUF4258 domain-containing protein [Zoogloeaceae bacterium]|jgi:hypothetical protein|nr:DUF4258 domain-containing protein [Zoogloeaceae bacterium]
MESKRFNRQIILTHHAKEQMAARNISYAELMETIEEGDADYKNATNLWLSRFFPARHDNLICAAVVLENALVVKTVMHHFERNPP